MNWSEILKLALPILIKVLGVLIPGLGSFLGIPVIGWIASWLIGKATDLLVDSVARLERYKAVDDAVKAEVEALKKATDEFKAVPIDASEEEKNAATVRLRAAAAALIKLRQR